MTQTAIPAKAPGRIKLFFAKQALKGVSKSAIIAVTGSLGKSTTGYILEQILKQRSKVGWLDEVSEIGDLTSRIWKLKRPLDRLVVEYDWRSDLQVNLYHQLFAPETVVVTNLSTPKGEFSADVEQVFPHYQELVSNVPNQGQIFLNYDDLNVRRLAKHASVPVSFFGLDSEHCHVWASNIRLEQFQTYYELNYGVERVEVRSPFLGQHQLYSQLAAASVAINLGIPLTTVKKVIEQLLPLDGHLQPIQGINGSVVIDDSNELWLDSLEAALETINQISAKRRLVVLTGLTASGPVVDRLHIEMAQKLYKDKIDLVFLIGDRAKPISEELHKLGMPNDRIVEVPLSELSTRLANTLGKGDVVLFKGEPEYQLGETVKRVAKARG